MLDTISTLKAVEGGFQLSLGYRVPTFLGKGCQLFLPCVHFVAAVFVCLSLWCWGLDVGLSVPELSCLYFP